MTSLATANDEPTLTLEPGGDDPALRSRAEAAVTALLRRAPSVDVLARAARRIRRLAITLLDAGWPAAEVTRVIASLHDAVAARVLELEVARVPPPPGVRVCWLALGSEGRGEQTLCTDQDNALAFEAGPGRSDDEARALLLPLARRVNAALARCGSPPCPGGIMAREAACCLSVEEWRARFAAWLEAPTPEALLQATVFFDLRGAWGDLGLADGLRSWIAARAAASPRFLALLAASALRRRPPLRLLGRLSLPRRGPHAGTLDLKLEALTLVVDAARVLALQHGVASVSTAERLRRAGPRAGLSAGEIAATIEAFHFVQVARLRLHEAQARAGAPLHNRLDPATLNPLDRRILVEGLRLAGALQRRLARVHRLDLSAACM